MEIPAKTQGENPTALGSLEGPKHPEEKAVGSAHEGREQATLAASPPPSMEKCGRGPTLLGAISVGLATVTIVEASVTFWWHIKGFFAFSPPILPSYSPVRLLVFCCLVLLSVLCATKIMLMLRLGRSSRRPLLASVAVFVGLYGAICALIPNQFAPLMQPDRHAVVIVRNGQAEVVGGRINVRMNSSGRFEPVIPEPHRLLLAYEDFMGCGAGQICRWDAMGGQLYPVGRFDVAQDSQELSAKYGPYSAD